METFILDGTVALNLSEMMAIDGGGAYEVGHAIGETIHDFFVGLWDGLTGK